MAPVTDIFLSHNWGRDESCRNNHYRVSFINQELTKRGYETWFDEDEMAGNIAERMSEGIQQTKAVIIFLTRKLFFLHKTTARILAVVMEECMRDIGTWTKLVGFDFSSRLYVDMGKDLEDRNYLHQQMESLQKQLQCMGIQPLQGNHYSFSPAKYCTKHSELIIHYC